ncbi:MAK10-like protein [Tanacetum coccineum]
MHVPRAYAKAISTDPRPPNANDPPKKGTFAFRKRVRPNPQPQALETIFEARVRDYMAAHTERMERFENAIFKQQEEINDMMAEMFGLLKELTSTRAPKKVLLLEEVDRDGEVESKTINEPIRSAEKDLSREKVRELVEAPRSKPVEFYLKHGINKELIEGLIGNPRFNDSLLIMQSGKMGCETYRSLPVKPMGKAILKKMITKKEDMEGSDVNVMPLSTYNRLTKEELVETDIRLFLASQSYIYPLGIAEDVLIEVAGFVYPIDFVILDIMEDRKRPFILRRPFLTTTKAEIKFDRGAVTLKSGKSKTNFFKTPEYFCKFEEREEYEIKRTTPISIMSNRILEWEERIKFHLGKEMEFDQWRRKVFNKELQAPAKEEFGLEDEGGVT